MIAWLKGTVLTRRDEQLVVDVNGVGYLLSVPVGVAADLAPGQPVELHVSTQMRENALALFGFDSPVQLECFQVLLGVSGVGPKLALNVLSSLTPEALAAAVEARDIARLKAAPGVGKRMAERLSVELKGKLAPGLVGGSDVPPRKHPGGRSWDDLRSALANLQFRPKEIDGVLSELSTQSPDGDFETLLRSALRMLRKA